jgi:hypothetical protein
MEQTGRVRRANLGDIVEAAAGHGHGGGPDTFGGPALIALADGGVTTT